VLCHCGSVLQVLEVRERDHNSIKRRTYQCLGATTHKVNTFEIPELAWKSAQYNIRKAVKGQSYHREIAARARLAAAMRIEREQGVSCPELAKKHGLSVAMVRYYTRMPRARLYPAAKKRKDDGN
jgi:hypothetical protein